MKMRQWLSLIPIILLIFFMNAYYTLTERYNDLSGTYEKVVSSEKHLEDEIQSEQTEFEEEYNLLSQKIEQLESELINTAYIKTVTYENKSYKLNLAEIPEIKQSILIELQNEVLLKRNQIERINPIVLYNDERYLYILVNYDSAVKNASFVLVRFDKKQYLIDRVKTIAYSCIFDESKVSKDSNNMALVFSIYQNSEEKVVKYSKMVVFNLNSFEIQEYMPFLTEFEYRVDSFDWIDDHSIRLKDFSDEVIRNEWVIFLNPIDSK